MKNQLLFVLALLGTTSWAQVKKEVRSVPAFNKVSFRIAGQAYVRQGSPQRVELEGNADFLAKVETEVKDGRLAIGREDSWRDWNWKDTDRITVWITVPTLEGLSVSGSGNLTGEGKFKVDNLDLNVSGSGNLTIAATADGEVEADVSGSGRLEVSGSCKTFDSDVSGSGRVVMNMNVYENATLGISGSGKIEGKGSAGILRAEISGSGHVAALNLEANKCVVRISGSGDVEITVKNELDANISGSGTVSYRGNPDKVNSNASGSGKVRKVD
jgi:carbon monoxide dehydrogenase subunit G